VKMWKPGDRETRGQTGRFPFWNLIKPEENILTVPQYEAGFYPTRSIRFNTISANRTDSSTL
jgi:hypothetical protein